MVQATYRYEKDFLGEKEIPADVYYGVQTLRAKTSRLLDIACTRN